MPSLSRVAEIVLEILREKGLKAPSDMHFKQDLHDPGLRAGTLIYSVYVQQITPGELLISTQRRNLLGVLMWLHENEGKFYFTAAAFIFAIALLVLYFSGIIITLVAMKKE